MVSLRFPFSFSQPSPKPPNSKSHFASRCITAVCVAAVGGAIAVSATTRESILQSALAPGLNICGWVSLSLADGVASEVKSKAGASFPAILGDSKRLLGVGLRRKNVFGLKNIDVYAFGRNSDTQRAICRSIKHATKAFRLGPHHSCKLRAAGR
ncbi:hypothetical protein QQ045_007870 [Rhodiola kirilowii]